MLQRKFDPEAMLAAIDRERIASAPMVPVMLQRILELDDEVRRALRHRLAADRRP